MKSYYLIYCDSFKNGHIRVYDYLEIASNIASVLHQAGLKAHFDYDKDQTNHFKLKIKNGK